MQNHDPLIYLLHFHLPRYHARHYLGTTTNLDRRLHDHANGNAARLTQAITTNATQWTVTALWFGDHRTEQWFKMQSNSPRYCPICTTKPLNAPATSIPLSYLTDAGIPLTTTILRTEA